MTNLTKNFLTLVVAGSLAVFFVQPTVAQTAKKLKCNGCVKSKQIKDSVIKSIDIKDGQVTNADLGNNAVTGGKIADGAVDSAKILDGAVDNAKILDGAVDSVKILDDTVNSSDLVDEAGANFNNSDNSSTALTGSATTVKSVTITAPRAGVVVVNASGYLAADAAVAAQGRCEITTLTTNDLGNSFLVSIGADETYRPFGATRGFDVAAGSNTFNLVCVQSGGSVDVRRVFLTAIYVPTKY